MKIAFVYMTDTGIVGKGAGYILASIPKHYDVTVFSTVNNNHILETINTYDIIMISTTTLLYNNANRIIQKANDTTVLVGGIHATIMGSKLLQENKNIDYLCIGEGETFIKEFLENYGKDSLFDINNLVYRKDEKIYTNKLNPIEDLSKLPEFPWKAFVRPYDGSGILYTTATRGCPYSCSYCCNSKYLELYGKSYLRTRPVEQVIKELKYLTNTYQFKLLYFGDELIFHNIEYFKDLARNIKISINRPYGCMGRAEYINEDFVNILKETGCRYVAIGIECGNEEFRKKYLNRHMSNNQIKNAFRLLKNAGIVTLSFNMVGYPVENDYELMKETEELNKEIDPDSVQVTWFYPFFGTKLYNYCIKNNLISDNIDIGNYHNKSILTCYKDTNYNFVSHSNREGKSISQLI